MWDEQTIKVYLDRKTELIFNHSHPVDNATAELPVFIGAYCMSSTCDPPGTGFLFQGEIDEVRISDTVRYTEEFSPPTVPFIPDNNTIALWHFDEGTGTVTRDASGNGNDGQLIGEAQFVAR